MSRLLYSLFLALYNAAIHIAALWSNKARLWVNGRKQWQQKLQSAMQPLAGAPTVWMHCASLGEHEQGRPVLENLRTKYPQHRIVLTFFSPSGYEVRKDWEGADLITYLPLDSPSAARQFLDIIKPQLALFVKYEFWHYYLKELEYRNVPSVLVSGAFRIGQPFFKWWGGFFRKILARFSVITLQDEASLRLLQTIGLGSKAIITGDTRYDRVFDIAAAAKVLPVIEWFKADGKLLIAGSTWPADEQLLRECLITLPQIWNLIIAPHEIDKPHIEQLQALFNDDAVLYSELPATGAEVPARRVLIIDNIGMLSSLYRYGELAFIGGGFSKGGIHNILEPAVFGTPVIMGPAYEKFVEAVELVSSGYAFPVNNAEELKSSLMRLTGKIERHKLHSGIHAFMESKRGATGKVMKIITGLLQ